MKINEEILFSASQVYRLMTDPKLKTDKEAGNLSQTALSYLDELFLRHEYGYRDVVKTTEMLKGEICEQDCIALVQQVIPSATFRLKNKSMFMNDYLRGIPDVILPDVVEDVKCSWDISTFKDVKEPASMYYWQAQAYMWLLGLKKFRLIYCLVNTPETLVSAEKMRYYYRYNCDEGNSDLIEIYEQIERNHNYDHIPAEKRVKCFEIAYNEADIERLKDKILKAREIYKTLTL